MSFKLNIREIIIFHPLGKTIAVHLLCWKSFAVYLYSGMPSAAHLHHTGFVN